VLDALRNALVPIVTVLGLTVALMIGGAVVTETVFGLPGVGNLVVSAVIRRDYPVIQGALLVVAVIYVVINFAIDLLYTVVDPRVKVPAMQLPRIAASCCTGASLVCRGAASDRRKAALTSAWFASADPNEPRCRAAERPLEHCSAPTSWHPRAHRARRAIRCDRALTPSAR
jgi:hypothetical protein